VVKGQRYVHLVYCITRGECVLLYFCVDSDAETHAENLPKFHYEVHHVAHKFGHRTPADVKLRDVARHAATMTADDDDDDDEVMPPAAAAADDTLQRSVIHSQRIDRPIIADDSSLVAAEKKLDDEELHYK